MAKTLQDAGVPAGIVATAEDRYYDPQDRHTWIDEVVFVQRANRLFRLELECAADQLTRFEPVFTHLLNSFQFECGVAQ